MKDACKRLVVPTSVLAPIMRDYIKRSGDTRETLAERSGVSFDLVSKILSGSRKVVSFATADALLSEGMHRADLWRVPPLAEHYL